MKRMNKIFAALLSAAMALQFLPAATVFAAEDEVPSVGLRVANKVDVALAVGQTDVDYSTLEADLRAALGAKTPAIPPSDISISAAQTLFTNTTNEFDWWVYDHTKPAGTIGTTDYNGVATIEDSTHTYVETMEGQSITNIVITPEMTPDPTNPDIGKSYHPYQGITSHMIGSDKGATMDFYGYPSAAYKDFRYLPNSQKTRKTFEFGIAEDVAYDALDGVGFFFNMEISGNYEDNSQTMSGYLLFLEYVSGRIGNAIKIYKFSDVSTKDFHHNNRSHSINSYVASGQFVEVAYSHVYSSSDKYRRIKLEVYPRYVRAYYVGSTADTSVATTKMEDTVQPVEFTLSSDASQAEQVELDASYVKSYGFGPMASYLSHACALPTHVTMHNLSMTTDKVSTLSEVAREHYWPDNTLKFLLNLTEENIEEFQNDADAGELLSRLGEDNIYYLGWCSDENAQLSEEFLRKYDYNGSIVNIDDAATDTYEKQVQALADEIYKRYWLENEKTVVLTTDVLDLKVEPESLKTHTQDLDFPEGKWKIVHTPGSQLDPAWSDSTALHPESGQYLDNLEFSFNLPGKYDIYYEDKFVNSVLAHRPPMAEFTWNAAAPEVFTSTSYDPDRQDAPNSGIVKTEWSWIDLTAGTGEPVDGTPPLVEANHIYLIRLTVTDEQGAAATIYRQISTDQNQSGTNKNNAPYAYFTLSDDRIIKGVGDQQLFVDNRSYGLYGEEIESTFTVTKDDQPFTELAISGTENKAYDLSDLEPGTYKVYLKVTSEKGDSKEVFQQFVIAEDNTPPTVTAAPETEAFDGNGRVLLNFADEAGGSGFNHQRFIVTDSPSLPAGEIHWSTYSSSTARLLAVTDAGENYVHYEAVDNAGNLVTGYFGPYLVNKEMVTMGVAVQPSDTTVYGTPVSLSVTLSESDKPYETSGKVAFYWGDTYLGSSYVQASENGGLYTAAAVFNAVNLSALNAGTDLFRAEFLGDTAHEKVSATQSYIIAPSSDASITAVADGTKTFDGTPYNQLDVTVAGAKTYTVEYVGVNGTTYGPSAQAPVNAGSYQAVATTTDTNYTPVSSAPVDFTIAPRELAISLSTSVQSGEAAPQADIGLAAGITGAVSLPPGKIAFYVNDVLVEEVAIEEVAGGYSASSSAWTNVPADNYTLKAVYVPAGEDNYTMGPGASNGVRQGFAVNKLDQTGFGFIESGDKTVTYGDVPFDLNAQGGQTGGAIHYEVVSANGTDGVVSVDPDTGKVTILGPGSAVVRAVLEGNSTYNQAEADITITVNKAPGKFEVGLENGQLELGVDIPSAIKVLENTGGGELSYSYVGRNGTTYGPSDQPPTAVGEYSVVVTTAETAYYTAVSANPIDFEVIPCGCEFTQITFDGKNVDIPYNKVQQTIRLGASAVLVTCANHNADTVEEFTLVNATEGVVIDPSTGEMTVNQLAAGKTFQVMATITHPVTGVTISKIADFTVVKEKENRTDGLGTSHDKNSSGQLQLEVDSYQDGITKVTVDGKELENGKDYSLENGKILFAPGFVEKLSAGQHPVSLTTGNTTVDSVLDIAFGNLNIAVTTAPELNIKAEVPALKESVVKPEDQLVMDYGFNVEFNMIVQGILNGQDAEVISRNEPNKFVGQYLDVSILRTAAGETTHIYTLDKPVTITLELPENLRGYSHYWIARVHHADGIGEAEYSLLPVTVTDNGTRLQFENDAFSTIAVLHDGLHYSDNYGNNGNAENGQGTTVHAPQTSDSSNLLLWMALLLVCLPVAGFALHQLKKQRKLQKESIHE